MPFRYSEKGVHLGFAQAVYLAGEDYSLADISLYAYTHVADEGGFNLREFPQICAWLARIEAQPGHQTMAQCLAAAS